MCHVPCHSAVVLINHRVVAFRQQCWLARVMSQLALQHLHWQEDLAEKEDKSIIEKYDHDSAIQLQLQRYFAFIVASAAAHLFKNRRDVPR